MIAAVFGSAWYVALLALLVAAAFMGRPRRHTGAGDRAESYELTRWAERRDHARRVREEELAEMRRQAPRAKP